MYLPESAVRKIVRLSKRVSIELTLGSGHMVCEWDPKMPAKLTAKELRRYTVARDEMLARLGTVAVVELV